MILVSVIAIHIYTGTALLASKFSKKQTTLRFGDNVVLGYLTMPGEYPIRGVQKTIIYVCLL